MMRCYNYSGKIKWKRDEITYRNLHYQVALNDNRAWKRYIDQIFQLWEYWNHPGDPHEEANIEKPDVPKAHNKVTVPQDDNNEEAQLLPELGKVNFQ